MDLYLNSLHMECNPLNLSFKGARLGLSLLGLIMGLGLLDLVELEGAWACIGQASVILT